MELETILSLESKIYQEKSYHQIFTILAEKLLNHYCIIVNQKPLRICEIEFYLKTPKHQDIFTHCDKDQQIFNRWYFHRQNGKSYKSGTYKGLDLTFGYSKQHNNIYGGILIRSIKDLETDKLIEGPCKVVDYILKLTDCKSIQELVTNCQKMNEQSNNETIHAKKLDNNSLLYITPYKLQDEQVYYGPRVGITLKIDHQLRRKYIMKDYRYLIFPDQIKKYKNTIALSLYHQNISKEDIMEELNIKQYYLDRYINDYQSELDYPDFIKKKMSIKLLSALYGLSKKNK